MKKLLFILTLLVYSISYSQPVQQEWVARYVRTPNTQVMGPFFALDKYGNSYVAGDNVINDSVNILVVKYNTSGVQQWATLYKYPQFGWFYPTAIALDSFGNAYVTAQYGQTALTHQNILTIKLNGLNGSVLWVKTYNGQYVWGNPEDLRIDKLNNIYVIGQSDSSLLCIKYNMNGDTQWVRKWHPPGDLAAGHGCTIDDSLNIIITGERSHCVDFPPPGICFDTLLAVKYSTDGILRWVKTYFNPAKPGANIGMKCVNDQNGSIYIAGKTINLSGTFQFMTLKCDRNGFLQWLSIYDFGHGDNIINSIYLNKYNNFVSITGPSWGIQNPDCATIKYNLLTGDSIWVRRYNGVSNWGDASNDIKIDSAGSTYITGNSYSPNSHQDIISMKYSNSGDSVWQVTFNGPNNGDDIGSKIELDNLNNVYICGSSQYDYIVIKYSQLIGIRKISSQTPLKFELFQNYPNPFNPITTIEFALPKTTFAKLIVYDLLGREVETLVNESATGGLKPGTYEVEFDGSKLSSGVYFYKLLTNDFTETKKMVMVK